MDNKYKIILASNSPRRKELLAGLDIAFEVVVKEGIDETYPENLSSDEVPLFLSRLKAAAYRDTMTANELVLTADTVVVVDDMILGKPSNEAEAYSHVAFAERANTSCRHGSKFDNFRETTQLQRDNRSDIQGVERCRNQLLC